MNNPNDNRPDDVNEAMQRMGQEFGQRPTPSGIPPGGAPPTGSVEYAEPQPVRLRIPLSKPRVVYVLIGINVVMYLLTELLARLQGGNFGFNNALLFLGGKYGPSIDAGEYWRFITPVFLHGGLIHLGLNSYALYSLGPEAERLYGSLRFLAIYLLAGLGGTIASYIWSPGLSIGASGAIFGLIGTLAAFYFRASDLLGREVSRERVNQMIGLAVVNIVLGFALSGTIDNAAHIGGLIVGGLVGLAMAPQFRVDERLYPPVVVRADRPSVGWSLAAVMLVVLVGIAAVAVMQLAGQRVTA